MTNHNLVAKKFVEDFLRREEAEATNEFKDTLTNAVEDLLDGVVGESLDDYQEQNAPLVWKKRPA